MNTNRHISWIDGLKGVSALIVLWHHLYKSFEPVIDADLYLYKWPLCEFANGGMAVSVFILLSAMTMTFICQDSDKWQGVMLKRYFRLMLPIAPIIAIYLILWYTGSLYNLVLAETIDNDWLISQPPTSVKTIFKVFLNTPFGDGSGWLGILWMLNYIFITPFVIVLLQVAMRNLTQKKQLIVLGVCIFLALINDPYLINIFYGYFLAKFVKPVESTKKSWLVLLGFAAIYTILSYAPLPPRGNFTFKAMAIVTCVALCEPVQRLLSSKGSVWFGHISFEIYLLHMLFIYTIGSAMYLYLPVFPHRLICIYVIVIGLSLLAAWMWQRFINTPIAKLTNKYVGQFINQ